MLPIVLLVYENSINAFTCIPQLAVFSMLYVMELFAFYIT